MFSQARLAVTEVADQAKRWRTTDCECDRSSHYSSERSLRVRLEAFDQWILEANVGLPTPIAQEASKVCSAARSVSAGSEAQDALSSGVLQNNHSEPFSLVGWIGSLTLSAVLSIAAAWNVLNESPQVGLEIRHKAHSIIISIEERPVSHMLEDSQARLAVTEVADQAKRWPTTDCECDRSSHYSSERSLRVRLEAFDQWIVPVYSRLKGSQEHGGTRL